MPIYLCLQFHALGFAEQLWSRLQDDGLDVPCALRQAGLAFEAPLSTLSITQFVAKVKDFFIIFDETPFIGSNPDLKDFIQFIRNLFRCVGRVLMLGTDSTISNVVTASEASRVDSEGKTSVWCHVFGDFPEISYASLQVRHPLLETYLASPLGDFILSILISHRPWLVDMFLSSFNQHYKSISNCVLLLNQISADIASKIVSSKMRGRVAGWMMGQARLQLPAYRERNRYLADGLTRTHLAYLRLDPEDQKVSLNKIFFENRVVLYRSMMRIVLKNGPFQPEAFFPEAKYEALLYMALMGTPETPAFQDATGRLPTCKVLNEKSTIPQLNMVNPLAWKLNGDLYEAWMSVASVIASHYGGLAGQKIESFLVELLFELFDCRAQFAPDSQTFLAKHFGDRRIPYLSPTNSPWPLVLNRVPGACVATLERPVDLAEVDTRTLDPESEIGEGKVVEKDKSETDEGKVGEDGWDEEEYEAELLAKVEISEKQALKIFLSSECKRRKKKVTLLSMINKMPSNSDIHFLLTREAVGHVQARTKSAILTRKVLLLKLGLVKGAWNLERYFTDQAFSSDLRVVILLDVSKIQDAVTMRKRKTTE